METGDATESRQVKVRFESTSRIQKVSLGPIRIQVEVGPYIRIQVLHKI